MTNIEQKPDGLIGEYVKQIEREYDMRDIDDRQQMWKNEEEDIPRPTISTNTGYGVFTEKGIQPAVLGTDSKWIGLYNPYDNTEKKLKKEIDPKDAKIKELTEEVEMLRKALNHEYE